MNSYKDNRQWDFNANIMIQDRSIASSMADGTTSIGIEPTEASQVNCSLKCHIIGAIIAALKRTKYHWHWLK